MKEKPKMTKVRVDDGLLEQLDHYDLFPVAVWSRQAKVNYCVQLGLSVLSLRFKDECETHQSDAKPVDLTTQILRSQAIERLIRQGAETKIPCSELARLVNRSLYEGGE